MGLGLAHNNNCWPHFGPPDRFCDGDCGIHAALLSSESPPNSCFREPRGSADLRQVPFLESNIQSGIHHANIITGSVTKSIGQSLDRVKSNCDSYFMRINPNWPQQENFVARVENYAKEQGLVNQRGTMLFKELGDRFGLTEETLKKFICSKTRPRPHLDTLRRVADCVGCSVLEFVDGGAVEATASNPEAGEIDRMILRSIGHDLPSLTEPQKLAATTSIF